MSSDKFTNVQKANAVLWYGVCGDSKVVQEKYKLFFKNSTQEIPSDDHIRTWYNNFRHTGYVDIYDAETHHENGGEVDPFVENESKFEQIFSRIFNKINKVLGDGPKIRTFHPYHMELIEFEVDDMLMRLKFAQTMLEHFDKWSQLIKTLWFSGEAKFYLDGTVECANLVFTKNNKSFEPTIAPHKVVQKYEPPNSLHLTVWASINAESTIGPFFIRDKIFEEAYLKILEQFTNELHRISANSDHPLFIQDDSKIHSTTDVQEYLEENFPRHWIGTGSTYATWPRHSPDLSPINFFLWGYIKSRVYKTPVGDLNELEERIRNTFKCVFHDLLDESMEEFKTRLERVIRTKGDLVDATIYGTVIDDEKLKIWGTYAYPYFP